MTRAIAGTMREHGPDCPGVGRPPVEPEAAPLLAAPSSTEETAVEPPTEPGAAVEPASAPERTPTPAYTVLDEDDGEIDGGAVTLRAQTSHADLPTGEPVPALLGPAQRSRIEQLEAEASEIEELRERAQRADAAVELQQVHQRRIRFLEGQLDAGREEAATLRDELSRARATLGLALTLLGHCSRL